MRRTIIERLDHVLVLDCGHRMVHAASDPHVQDAHAQGAPAGHVEMVAPALADADAVEAIECPDCVALVLPAGAERYRSTPEFTPETLPTGLQRDHRTRAGTWGVIEVIEGEVDYQVTAPFAASRHLCPGQTAAIPPGATHHVRFSGGDGAARLRVDFYRLQPTDSPSIDPSSTG